MNESLPFESEEEESVGSESETAAAELNGRTAELMPVRVEIRRSSARILAAEVDGGIGRIGVREKGER